MSFSIKHQAVERDEKAILEYYTPSYTNEIMRFLVNCSAKMIG